MTTQTVYKLSWVAWGDILSGCDWVIRSGSTKTGAERERLLKDWIWEQQPARTKKPSCVLRLPVGQRDICKDLSWALSGLSLNGHSRRHAQQLVAALVKAGEVHPLTALAAQAEGAPEDAPDLNPLIERLDGITRRRIR